MHACRHSTGMDHNPQSYRFKNKGRKIWRYSYANWDRACEAIDSFDWNSIMSDDINVACENWLNQFMLIIEQYIPNCFLKSRHNLPWLTKPLINSIKKKNLLFKRAKSSGNFRKYEVHCNRTLADLRAAKKDYFQKLNPRVSGRQSSSCQKLPTSLNQLSSKGTLQQPKTLTKLIC